MSTKRKRNHHRHWRPAREVEIRYAVERLGLTEADVRDARWWLNRDAVTIRTHNWRRFDVTGLELVGLERNSPRKP